MLNFNCKRKNYLCVTIVITDVTIATGAISAIDVTDAISAVFVDF